MGSFADVFASVKLDLAKEEEAKLQKRIGRIDSSKAGKQVATRFGVGFNGAFGGIASKSAGLFAGAFAAIKGAQVFGSFITDAAESAKISRLTAAAIKSTGGAAKISASQVSDLATSISNKAAVDDEAVQSGANLLLTFTGIRNETGKGNDIFNQATRTVTDMTAALNNGKVTAEGMKGSSIQLGKALNDPIKGVSSLAKVGVSFTADQKKQIKTLVESGKTMEAQKVILGELNKEFGGAAVAAAGPMDRLKVVAGNLGEEVGTFLLPHVERFSNFLVDDALPAARDLFGYFKAEALPRLREFGGFFKEEVLPPVKDFGGFLKNDALPALGSFAGWIGKHKDFFGPFALALGGIVVAVKAWGIAQGILNVVLAANPIGLIVIAVAGLAAGLIYAYKHSDKFRQVVQGAWSGIQAVVSFAWKNVIKPAVDAFGAAFPVVKEAARLALSYIKGQFGIMASAIETAWRTVAKPAIDAIGTVWETIKKPLEDGIKFVVDKFLGLVEFLLKAQAKAFGWIPGIGDKLKTAADEFATFRDEVNDKLAGIDDQTINVGINLPGRRLKVEDQLRGNYAMGGPIRGPGTGTSDTAGLFALSNGEHVWTAEEVRKAGGHAAMYQMRQAVRSGLAGFATGGSPGFTVRTPMPNTSQFAKEVAAHSVQIAKPFAQQIAKQFMGPGGPPGSRQAFRGVMLNERTIRMLLAAERILGRVFRITQGSYSTSVSASGSTHAGGGAMDTNGPGGWNAAVNALRRSGFAAWHRTPSQGPWGHHIHSIAIGDPTASAAAKAQVRDFLRGGNGLRGMHAGGAVFPRFPAQLLDRGGVIPPGPSMVWNGTGRPEGLRRTDHPVDLSDGSIDRLATAVQTRSGNFHLYDTNGVLIGTMRGVIADENRKTARDYGLN